MAGKQFIAIEYELNVGCWGNSENLQAANGAVIIEVLIQ
jgi:hypothetical protein